MQEQTKECPKCRHHNHKLYYRIKSGYEVGHCKHCGHSYKTQLIGGHAKAQSKPLSTKAEYTLPKGFTSDWGGWRPEAVRWVTKYGITQAECEQYKIGMSPKCDRLWLTVWDGDGLAWMQGRALDGQLPKYNTLFNRQHPFYIDNGDTIFITEDVLSAIKVGRQASAIALTSTSMSLMHLKYICRHKRAVIALDNDNSVVKKQQEKIKKALDNYIPASIWYVEKDVKEYTNEEMEKI